MPLVQKTVPIDYVGIGGKIRTVQANMSLGVGVFRRNNHGIFTRILWDFCWGYTSGFRFRDIFYFLLTRSLSDRVWGRVHRLECSPKRGWNNCCPGNQAKE